MPVHPHELSKDSSASDTKAGSWIWATGLGVGLVALMLTWFIGHRLAGLVWSVHGTDGGSGAAVRRDRRHDVGSRPDGFDDALITARLFLVLASRLARRGYDTPRRARERHPSVARAVTW